MKFFQMKPIKAQTPSLHSHFVFKTLAREIGRTSKWIEAKLVEIGLRTGARLVKLGARHVKRCATRQRVSHREIWQRARPVKRGATCWAWCATRQAVFPQLISEFAQAPLIHQIAWGRLFKLVNGCWLVERHHECVFNDQVVQGKTLYMVVCKFVKRC